MTPESKIINYLQQQSNGVINLSSEQAAAIVKMAQPGIAAAAITGVAYVKFNRWDGTNSTWELIQLITTTDAIINTQIKKALAVGPIDGFYKYELYNQAGEYEGLILTADNNLF